VSSDAAHVAYRVDASLFSRAAVVRAAYKFTDRCYVLLTSESDVITVIFAGLTATSPVTSYVGAFANELIDQQLRLQLDAQFAPLRTLIAAHAFAEGNLLEPSNDIGRDASNT
jgi:His-Xaa-Ser system protein HxsD